MSLSRTPELPSWPLRSLEEEQPSVERYGDLPTTQSVKDNWLFGIPLKSALTNQELPDTAIQRYINSALSELEHLLDIYITPVRFRDRHDYTRIPFLWNNGYIKLDHPNVITVYDVSMSFTNDVPDLSDPANPRKNQYFVTFPLEYVFVQPQEGVIQLVPAFGTSLSGFILSALTGTQYYALAAAGIQNLPGSIYVEYLAGFPQGKVPAMISTLIEMGAAIKALSTLGPILFPYTSVSVSIDGTSQGTSGFGPKFLNDRLQQLKEDYEKMLDIAKGAYQRRWLIDWM